MAQKYQEQQLAAIKESRNQVIEDLSSGNVPATNPDLSSMFGALQMGPAKEPERVRLPENGLREMPGPRNGAMMNGDGFGPAQNGGGSAANPMYGNSQAKPPITLPRYVPQADRQSVNGYQTVAQSGLGGQAHVSQSNGISVSQSQARQAPQYTRQYSDSVFETNQNGFNNNNFNTMPPSAAPRPIKKLQREE